MTRDPIDNKTLLDLYAGMLRIRLVELAIEAHYPEDQMKTPIHSSIGQEAVAVGVCAHLSANDTVFSNHRCHAHYLAKGGDLKAMIAELYNRSTGCARGRGGSMHLTHPSVGFPGASAIVGGGIALAAGAALAFRLQSKDSVSVAFFGDGAVEEGILYESINFAALKTLPLVFICENNFYAVCSPLAHRQKPIPIWKRFMGFDIPCMQVDGNDIEEVYRVTGAAVCRARQDKGPSFIECLTYRLRDHHGTKTGVDAGYRTQEEWEEWERKCPIKKLEDRLREKGLTSPAQKAVLISNLEQEIAEAFAFARNSPLPDPRLLFDSLYV